MKHYAARMPSSMGDLFAVVDEGGALVWLDFLDSKMGAPSERDLERRFAGEGIELAWNKRRLARVARSLREYFAGQRRSFDLALAPRGTAFQKRVWAELLRIPYGETSSYAGLARRIGRPRAARAVGRANATNPISLVVPCHRVVGADGSLTGYAGGEERKRALLELEGATLARA